jgi:hypothetical protein
MFLSLFSFSKSSFKRFFSPNLHFEVPWDTRRGELTFLSLHISVTHQNDRKEKLGNNFVKLFVSESVFLPQRAKSPPGEKAPRDHPQGCRFTRSAVGEVSQSSRSPEGAYSRWASPEGAELVSNVS